MMPTFGPRTSSSTMTRAPRPSGFILRPGSTEHKRVPRAFFRRTIKLGDEPLRLAGMQLYGDTHIKVFVNGKLVGEQFARQNLSAPVKPLLLRIYDIKGLLKPGENVIAVEARNYGTERPNLEPGGPPRCAGFHFYGEIVDRDGRVQPVAFGPSVESGRPRVARLDGGRFRRFVVAIGPGRIPIRPSGSRIPISRRESPASGTGVDWPRFPSGTFAVRQNATTGLESSRL